MTSQHTLGWRVLVSQFLLRNSYSFVRPSCDETTLYIPDMGPLINNEGGGAGCIITALITALSFLFFLAEYQSIWSSSSWGHSMRRPTSLLPGKATVCVFVFCPFMCSLLSCLPIILAPRSSEPKTTVSSLTQGWHSGWPSVHRRSFKTRTKFRARSGATHQDGSHHQVVQTSLVMVFFLATAWDCDKGGSTSEVC